MHIILDGRLILAQQTGISRYLLGTLSGLKNIPCDDDFEVWLQRDLPGEHPVWRLGASNIRLRRVPLKHMDWRAQYWAPYEIGRSKPDLFHYPHFDLPWLAPGQIILTIYDLKYLSRPDYFYKNGDIKRWIYRKMLAHSVSKAQLILTISQSSARDLTQRLGVDPQKMRVIPLGVDDRFYRRCPEEELAALRSKYHLAPETLLFIGERRPHKNILQLIRVFALLQKFHGDCQLVIAGKSYADYQAPQALVEALGLAGCVRFLDYVQEGDLPALYQSAAVFCTLSEYEGFGLPVVEAMASGLPVIAAKRTALPEIVGDAGILVDPEDALATADAISLLLSDASRCKDLIQRGLARARVYSWDQCARQTLAAYHEGR